MANEVIPFEALTKNLATTYQVSPIELINTFKAMVFKNGACTDAELYVVMKLSQELGLNPLNRELHAFTKDGKMQTIVGYDGWIKMVNRHPQFNGFEFFDHLDEKGQLTAVTCRMWRKDWTHPGEVTEYMDECVGDTVPWKKWKRRMLRNKAYIQGARLTFGFAGVVDPDEAERIETPGKWPDAVEVKATVVKDQQAATSDLKRDRTYYASEIVEPSAAATPKPPPSGTAAAPAEAVTHADPPAASAPSATGEAPDPRTKLDKAYDNLRTHLDALIARHVKDARLKLLLGQVGAVSVEAATDEQIAMLIQRIEARRGK
jgi:hypothetical protein